MEIESTLERGGGPLMATAARRVRVVIESDVEHVSRSGLMHIKAGALPVAIDPEAVNVKVEDIGPTFCWSDGDIILGDSNCNVYLRRDGAWKVTGSNRVYNDNNLTAAVDAGATVLRYQVGEDQ